MTMETVGKGTQGALRMWLSPEAATRIYDVASWALIISLVVSLGSTVLIMSTARVTETTWNSSYQVSRAAIARLEAAVREANARAAQAQLAIEDANTRASEAAAQATDANARATQAGAELALLKYKLPRMLYPEQQSRIIEKLRSFPPAPYDLAVVQEPEATGLVQQIHEVLKATHWIHRDVQTEGREDADGVDGITIEIADEKRAEWESPVIALVLALRAEGIHVNGVASTDADPSAIHVKIGRKPQAGESSRHVDNRTNP